MEPTSYGTLPTMQTKVSSKRETISQLVAINAINVVLFLNGMIAGYPTVLIPGLLSDKDESMNLTESEISWIGSISYMCSIIGCFLSGMVTQPIGRSRSVHMICPLLFAFLLIFKFSTKIWHIYLALSLCGCFIAVAEAPILSYKAEVSQPRLRGFLGATSTLSVISGVLVQFILGTFFHWRTVATIAGSLALLLFIFLFFIPESPHWLIMHNKINHAQQSLAWLRGWTTLENVEEEFQKMCNNYKDTIRTENENVTNSWRQYLLTYTRKSFLWPLSLVSFIFFLTSFTGICTLQTYAVNIFATFQAPIDEYYAMVILGVTQVAGSFVALFVIKRFGKRVVGFVSIWGVAICNIIVGGYAFINSIKYLTIDLETAVFEETGFGWLPLCVFILMAFIGHTGIRVIPWIVLSEIFPHNTRAIGCGVGSAVFYLFGFLANKVFLVLISYLQIAGIYWMYAAISVIGFIIMYFFLPETEGKDLQDIINHFAEVSQLDNSIERSIIETSQPHPSLSTVKCVEEIFNAF